MKFRALIYIIVLASTLAACTKEHRGAAERDGYGTLILDVSTTTMSRSGAQDGDAINSLRVWIADGSGKIRYCRFLTPDQEATSQEIEFKDVKRGVYTLYAAANFTGLDAYTEGATIDDAFTKKVLDTIEDGSAPDFSQEGMPLSIVKSISVGPGDNPVSASLKRCVGKISITIRNNIAPQTAIYIAGVGLSRHNPSAGYLFPQSDGSVPSASKNVVFRDFREDDSAPELYKVSYGSPVQVYETYLYETGEAAAPFTFNLLAGIYDSSTEAKDVKFHKTHDHTFSKNLDATLTSTGRFLLRSAESSTWYMGNSTVGGLQPREFDSDMELNGHSLIHNYIWTFDHTDFTKKNEDGEYEMKTRITNVGTGLKLVLDSDGNAYMDSEGTEFTMYDIPGKGLRFRSGDNYLSIAASNGIGQNAGLAGKPDKDNASLWLFRLATENSEDIRHFANCEYEIPRADRPVNYLDKYGNSRTLKQISRNDHINIAVNIFYNRELGDFEYSIEGWDKADNETTFD